MKNLAAEMARFGVSNAAIQGVLHCSLKTVVNKVGGVTEFTVSEAMKIRDELFPGLRIEYLFSSDADTPRTAQ